MTAAAATEPRPRCARCRRPQVVCYCAALPHLPTATKVVILQHPRERDVAIGTARMASLALPEATLHVGVRWGEHVGLRAALADPARPPILLYPGPGARDILREPPPGPVTLVVVDGTWSQARVVVRDNPVLHALPRYAFETPEPTQYRIRKEPRAEYCSTIEALMHVLGVLEGDAARFRALLDPMRAMIDAQIDAQARSPRRTTLRVERGPRPPRRPLPPELVARWHDLVVLVGEANAWPYRGGPPDPARADELVHLVVHRPATGATFARVIAPQRALSPTAAFHTKLTEDRLRAGDPRADVMAALAAFLSPDDIVCTWGHYGAERIADAGGTLPADRIDLRAAAHRYTNRKIGTLEAYAASHGAAPPPITDGRAGERAAMLVQILAAWRRLDA